MSSRPFGSPALCVRYGPSEADGTDEIDAAVEEALASMDRLPPISQAVKPRAGLLYDFKASGILLVDRIRHAPRA